MSWCRWGSPCNAVTPKFTVDNECVAQGCPGSDIYIYDSVNGKTVCCNCPLSVLVSGVWDNGADYSCYIDFECETEEQMLAHILEHDAAGHHVRRSLRDEARGIALIEAETDRGAEYMGAREWPPTPIRGKKADLIVEGELSRLEQSGYGPADNEQIARRKGESNE